MNYTHMDDALIQKFTKNIHISPFIDQQKWVRILYRSYNKFNLTYQGTLNAEDIAKMEIKDIAFSDNQYSAVTNESWTNTNPPINQVIANVFNGKTPTGTQWSQDYEGGYLYYQGVIQTYGDFKSFYMGWKKTDHIKIGTQSSLRSGGGKNHTGEFIHSSCNGY